MTIGAGLGAFVEGLAGGMKARQAIDDAKERKADREEARQDRATAREDQAVARQDQAIAREELGKQRANSEQIAGIGKQATAEANAEGANKAEVWERYYGNVAKTYAEQGRPDLARQYSEWAQNESTKRGVNHFQNAMVLFDMAKKTDGTHDETIMQKGLDQLRKAQAIKGYGGDRGFSFNPIIEGEEGKGGKVIGYRITFKDYDGNEISKDVAPGDVPRAAALAFNPDASFKDRQAHDAEIAKKKEETLKLERGQWQKAEETSRSEYEERRKQAELEGGKSGKTMKPWDDLGDGERDRIITGRARSMTPPSQRQYMPGLGLAPQTSSGPSAIFDKATGQVVRPPAPALGAGAANPQPNVVPSPTAPSEAAATPSRLPATPRQSGAFVEGMMGLPGNVANTATSTASSFVDSQKKQNMQASEQAPEMAQRFDDIAQGATEALEAGASPRRVMQNLILKGVPAERWPQSLRSQVAQQGYKPSPPQSSSFTLGLGGR